MNALMSTIMPAFHSCQEVSVGGRTMQADAPQGSGWLVAVELSNGRRVEADFVISAVGVIPNTQWLGHTLALHPTDQGILVNRQSPKSL